MTEPKTAAGKALQDKVAKAIRLAPISSDIPWHIHSANAALSVLGLTWDTVALRADGMWVMVPKEPTNEMLAEGWRHVNTGLCEDGRERELEELWAGMLAAAPQAGGQGMSDQDELDHALELILIGRPYQYHPGSGQVTTPYDHPMEPAASFKDWGLALAVAIALNAINAGQLRRLADQPQLKARAEQAEALVADLLKDKARWERQLFRAEARAKQLAEVLRPFMNRTAGPAEIVAAQATLRKCEEETK